MASVLFVKNMVCQRCIMTVEQIFRDLAIPVCHVALGEVKPVNALEKSSLDAVNRELQKVGFELIESRLHQMIENIKLLVLEYVEAGPERSKNKLSTFITAKIYYDYSYLSALFSSVEGQTIEQFFISTRIEKVKEQIVYDQMSLSEIAFQAGFSSVHHLSAQFKKITGLTPSHFKKIAAGRRRPFPGP